MYILKKILLIFTRYIYQKLHYFKYFKKSKFSDYFNYLWILYIGSNHGRRHQLYVNKKDNQNTLKEYEEINKKISFNQSIKNKDIIIFLGDSHAEFYGRNYNSNFKTNKFFLSIWLGPVLLLNFCKSVYSINRSIFFLDKIIKKFGKSNKYHIILTFGEIDIRTSFYQFLKVYKTHENLEILLNDIINSLNETIFLIKKKLKYPNNLKFYFKEPTPTTNREGYLTTNIEEVKKLIFSLQFPIMGKASDRVIWHKSLVEKLKRNNDNLTFLEISKNNYNDKGAINQKFSDDHHITSAKLIQEFQNFLINNNVQ